MKFLHVRYRVTYRLCGAWICDAVIRFIRQNTILLTSMHCQIVFANTRHNYQIDHHTLPDYKLIKQTL